MRKLFQLLMSVVLFFSVYAVSSADSGKAAYNVEEPNPLAPRGFFFIVSVTTGGGQLEIIINGDGDDDDRSEPGEPEPGTGAVWYVDGAGNARGDGSSWATAFHTLDAALESANGGDSLWVKHGIYHRDRRTGELVVNKPLAIYGGFTGTESELTQRNWEQNQTIVDGGGETQCFDVASGAIVDGLIIQNCSGQYGGGMIIMPDAGKSDISPVVRNSRFTENRASDAGGAIYVDSASPEIDRCQFGGNSAGHYGGAIHSLLGSPFIVNSTFRENSAVRGGGISAFDSWDAVAGDPQIVNTLFWKNSADMGGGAIYNVRSSPGMINSSFNANEAGDGGAIFNVQSSPVLKNLILWGDTPNEIGQPDRDSSDPDVSYSIIQQGSYAGRNHNIETNPYFANASEGELHLLFETELQSPAVDSGGDIDLGTDRPEFTRELDMNPRYTDGDGDGAVAIDRGAYEYQRQLPVPYRRRTYDVAPAAVPKLSANPVEAIPMALGAAAEGADSLLVQIRLVEFAAPMDVYLGLRGLLPGLQEWHLLGADNAWHPLSGGFVPWKVGVVGPVSETPFGEFPSGSIPEGSYMLGVMVKPAGDFSRYHLWLSRYDHQHSASADVPVVFGP